MASPTTAINRFDLAMTFQEFNLELDRRGFIGAQLFRPTTVGMQNAKFAKIKIAALLEKIEQTKRAPKGGYPRDDFEWETDNYHTDEHGVEEPLDDRKLRMYGDIIRAETLHRNRGIDRVIRAYENTCASTAFDTGTFNTSDVTGDADLSNNNKWTDKANADPVEHLDHGIETAKSNCGVRPNVAVMSDLAFRRMVRTDRIENLIKHNGSTDPTALLRARRAMADLLMLDEILIADAPMKNTADKGQSASLSRIWGADKCLLAVRATDDDLESPNPAVGRTLMWSEDGPGAAGADDEEIGVIVEEYREEGRRGSVIRARTDYEVKLLHSACGHLLTNLE